MGDSDEKKADEEKFERLLAGRQDESEVERDIRLAALKKLNKKLEG